MNTLSVFAAECGIDTQTPLSELDIIQSLQYGSRTGLYNLMKEKENNEYIEAIKILGIIFYSFNIKILLHIFKFIRKSKS